MLVLECGRSEYDRMSTTDMFAATHMEDVAERANRSLLSSVLCNFSANFLLAVLASIAYFSRH